MEPSLSTFIFSGGVLAVAMACGHCIRNSLRDRLVGAFLFCLGFLQIVSSSFYSQNSSGSYEMILAPAVLLAGPLLYFVYRSLYGDAFRLTWRTVLHVLPSLAAALLGAAAYAAGRQGEPSAIRFKLIITPALLSVMIYITYIFLHVRRYARGRLPALSAALYFLLAFAALVGLLVDGRALTRSVNAAAAVLIVFFFLAEYRDPELLNRLASEVQKRRESQLRGLDLEALRVRLFHLMEQEKVFCDEDLTLPALAGMAGISTHQLSLFINTGLNKNFNRFINEFRIKEARMLLLDEPERTTLSIGMAVGFNSNSVFHQAFRELTGHTPARFRKLNRSLSAEL